MNLPKKNPKKQQVASFKKATAGMDVTTYTGVFCFRTSSIPRIFETAVECESSSSNIYIYKSDILV